VIFADHGPVADRGGAFSHVCPDLAGAAATFRPLSICVILA
jgi:hypothetical protein